MNPTLTQAQKDAIKAVVQADPALAPALAAGNDQAVADALNQPASPDYYVWRSAVAEAEYTGTAGSDVANAGAATAWSWPAFIARSLQEQYAWGRMFATGSTNPSLANVRQGVADIFSGSTNSAPAQRTHLAVLSKRKATRAEKALAAATAGGAGPRGSFANPDTMATEGAITPAEVSALRG